jgi:hypothetical protein
MVANSSAVHAGLETRITSVLMPLVELTKTMADRILYFQDGLLPGFDSHSYTKTGKQQHINQIQTE